MPNELIIKIIECQHRVKRSVQLTLAGLALTSAGCAFFTSYTKLSIAATMVFGLASEMTRWVNIILDNSTTVAIFVDDEENLKHNAIRVTEQSPIYDCVTGKHIDRDQMYCKCVENHYISYDTKNMLRVRRIKYYGLSSDDLKEIISKHDGKVCMGDDELDNTFICIKLGPVNFNNKKDDDISLFYDKRAYDTVFNILNNSWWVDRKLTHDVRCPKCDSELSKALMQNSTTDQR